MTPANRSLLMRANRLLGAQLVEQNLIKIDDLEAANEKLLDLIGSGSPRQRTVLGILAYDLKVLREEDVLLHQRELSGTGLVDLRHYETNEEIKNGLDLEPCWVTWSVPFDVEEDMTYIATAYFLSPAVRKYWEDRYNDKVLWYGTTLESIADHLENLQNNAPAPPSPPKPVIQDLDPVVPRATPAPEVTPFIVPPETPSRPGGAN